MSEFYRVDTGANGSVFVRNTSALNYVIAHSEGAGSTSITGGSVGISNTSPVSKFEVHDTAGELLSINNDLTSTVFSANDVSGLPMIEATANGNVIINRFRQGNLDVRGGILGESDSYTKLLIHSDTNDGNTCFIDSSSSEHTLTAVGDPQHLTAQKKFGSTSMCFDGGDDTISFPVENVTTDFDFGTGAFTIDTWINFSDVTSTGWQTILGMGYSNGITVYWNDNNLVYVYLEGVGTTYAWTPTIDTWYHLAVVRSGTDLKVYVNGVQIGTTITSSNDIIPNVTTAYIGAQSISGPTLYFRGYLDEFRISKGIARWTDNFIPPARPYSTVTSEFFEEQDRLTTAMTALNNGNVGIGTTTPDHELEIADANPTLSLCSTSYADPGGRIVFLSPQGVSGQDRCYGSITAHSCDWNTGQCVYRDRGGMYLESNDTATAYYYCPPLEIAFKTSVADAGTPTERMRIDDQGNVGIGCDSPAEKLHVHNSGSGHTYILACNTNTATWQSALQLKTGNTDWIMGTGAGTDTLWFHNPTTAQTRMTICSSGEVGIGTTTPTRPLHICNNCATWDHQMKITSTSPFGAGIALDSTGTDGDLWYMLSTGSSSSPGGGSFGLYNVDDGAYRLTIMDGTGNVGIGTTTPDSIIHTEQILTGEAARCQAFSAITLQGCHASIPYGTTNNFDGFGPSIDFKTRTYNNTTQMVRAYIRFQLGDNSGATTQGTSIKFGTQNAANGTAVPTDKMTIRWDGNVGIGTSLPTAKLDIKSTDLGYNATTCLGWGGDTSLTLRGSNDISGKSWVSQRFFGTDGDAIIRLAESDQHRGLQFGVNNSKGAGLMFAVTMQGDGKVGINSDAGDLHSTLQVGAPDIQNCGIRITNAGTVDCCSPINFGGSSTAPIARIAGVVTSAAALTAGGLVFETRSATNDTEPIERMRIDEVGNVGIGNSAPNQPLSVVSETDANFNDIASFYTNNKTIGVEIHNKGIRSANNMADGSTALDANVDFYIDSKGTGDILIGDQSSGNVGIRHGTPTSRLHIGNAPDSCIIAFDQGGRVNSIGTYFSSGATASRIDFFISDGTTNAGANNRMSITGGGKVGIGTCSPDSILHVCDASAYLKVQGTAATDDVKLGLHSLNWNFTITNQGNNGNIVYQSDDAQDQIWNTDNEFNAATERFRIGGGADTDSIVFSNSNVGIGNTAPQGKFDVHGSAGELLAITNDLSDVVFSANDVSGLPMIQACADGNVQINPFRQGYLSTGSASGVSYSCISRDCTNKFKIYSDDAETSYLDGASTNWVLMKTFRAGKTGCLHVEWESEITGGQWYYGWRFTAENATRPLYMSDGTSAYGHYNLCLHSGNTHSVHAYRCFQVPLCGFRPGDLIEFWMAASANQSIVPVVGNNNQYLRVCDFRFYSASPSVEWVDTNVWGKNVGIGTTTPATELHVNGSNGYRAIRLSSGSADIDLYANANNPSTGLYSPDNFDMDFNVGGNQAMVIRANCCFVGIGTPTPCAKLTVDGGGIGSTTRRWDNGSLAGNNYWVCDSTDGFALGIGTGESTWFSWDSSYGHRIAISVWNDGSMIKLGYGTGDTRTETFICNCVQSPVVCATNYINSSGDITAYASDCRMKCNVLTINCATERIKRIRGVEFEWDRKYICDCNLGFTPAEEGTTLGFIAQELEPVIPDAVREAPFESGMCRTVSWAEKYKTVKPEKIIPLLVEATKEQQCTIEKQQRRIDTLTQQVEMLLAMCGAYGRS